MKPTKAKELITSTAMELNIPVNIVEDVVTTYWKDIRSSLSELKSPIVHVYAFGNFTIKHWLLEKEKQSLIKIKEHLELKKVITERTANIINDVILKIRLIEEMEKMFYSEKQRKDFIKTHKKRYVKTDI